MNRTYDLTWYVWEMWITTEIELFLAITAASIPGLKPFWVKYVGAPVMSAYASYGRSRARSMGKKSTQLSSREGFSLVSRERRSGYHDVDADQPWKSNYEMRVVNVEVGGEGISGSPPHGITHSTTFQVKSEERPASWGLPPNEAYRPGVATIRESEEMPRHSESSGDLLSLPRHGTKEDSMV